MEISIIVACSENGVIGKDNRLPWHLPADLAYFKRMTQGKPIIMGRKTHQSIGRALPGRKNIVISRNKTFDATGCLLAQSLDDALALAKDSPEVMVIGGEAIYRLSLPYATRVYRTLVKVHIEGDSLFPALHDEHWQRVDCKAFAADEANPLAYAFEVFKRK